MGYRVYECPECGHSVMLDMGGNDWVELSAVCGCGEFAVMEKKRECS